MSECPRCLGDPETGRMVPASALEDALVGLRFAYEGLTAHERAALSNTIARAEAALAAAVPSTADAVLAGLVEEITAKANERYRTDLIAHWTVRGMREVTALVQSRLSDLEGGER